ncbi:MAG: hypothetical protein GQ583_09670, partial [Methyloprofundus sp.]|nr:hypothetical protein [Methyloprofundus sp.]
MFSRQNSIYRTLLSTVFCLLFLPNLNAKPLEYLYINAREGSASGGHTALRFNNETFHFQHYDGGIIRLIRHDSVDFDFQYRYTDNRTLYQATVDLDDVHYEQLRDYFNLLYLQQKQQDNLLKEIYLNISLLHKQTQQPLLSIKGAGLFMDNTAPHRAEASTIYSLQQKIKQKYAENFLNDQIQGLKEEINTLKPL